MEKQAFGVIPLKEGKYLWNMYFLANKITYGGPGLHPFLVIDVLDDDIFGILVTHSKKSGTKNNFEIRNLNSKDLRENKIRNSYLSLKPLYRNHSKKTKRIKISDLKRQINDLYFKKEEKVAILQRLSTLERFKTAYLNFIKKERE